MRTLQQFLIGSAVTATLGLPVTSAWSRSDSEVLVMEMVSVTGVLELAARTPGGGTVLAIDSGAAMGVYRIDERGLGAELLRHLGELVTVVAVVSPSAADGGRVLRVERFTLHLSSREHADQGGSKPCSDIRE